MNIRLIGIGSDGQPVAKVSLPDAASSACKAMASLYRESGYVQPWIGYLAEEDGQAVGTCAFKSPPREMRVEIAYHTFLEHEGRGIATEMARQLVQIACTQNDKIVVVAQTLPQENASTAILRKLGFSQIGMAYDDEVGDAWEWQLRQSHGD